MEFLLIIYKTEIMKIFISHSPKDKQYAITIAKKLKSSGYELSLDPENKIDDILTATNKAFETAEGFIIIISESTLNNEWLMDGFSQILFQSFSKEKPPLTLVLVDNSIIPQYLTGFPCINYARDGIDKLIEILSKSTDKDFFLKKKEEKKHSIEELKRLVKIGRLTLICGAGVSIKAGIPDWDKLLTELLMSAMSRNHISNDITNPSEFTSTYKISPIIFAKFLKQILGTNYFSELRNCLYSQKPESCPNIDAIIKLVEYTKRNQPIDSIITFNFDSLIEENLEKKGIKHRAIFSEEIKYAPDELAIYHVHGYIPKEGEISYKNGIIFSEDAYHSQFIDPYSWSNIILLNKLSQNTCLFIGTSLSDPNLRRLLDVSHRKNPRAKNHFVIEKIPILKEKDGIVDHIATQLKEQDSNGLGLNIIWIDDYWIFR